MPLSKFPNAAPKNDVQTIAGSMLGSGSNFVSSESWSPLTLTVLLALESALPVLLEEEGGRTEGTIPAEEANMKQSGEETRPPELCHAADEKPYGKTKA